MEAVILMIDGDQVLVEIPGGWPKHAYPAFPHLQRPLQHWSPEGVRLWMGLPSPLSHILEILQDGGYTSVDGFRVAPPMSDEPDLTKVDDL